MQRIYDLIIEDHIRNYKQMLFLTGPRQVGKTTIATHIRNQFKNFYYYNWDVFKDREKILAGQEEIAKTSQLDTMHNSLPIIVFDEIHKYSQWKTFVKGFFDLYKEKCRVVVTGSSRLDTYNKGGDSMMGRYFSYNVFPFTVGELTKPAKLYHREITPPKKVSEDILDNLWVNGGFPEPFLRNNNLFTGRWKSLRNKQLFKEDIRELSNIQEVEQLEVLAKFLQFQVGQLLNRSELSKKIRVSVSTISRWINTLEMFYHCFEIKPWSQNVKRTLVKEPKVYLYDWSALEDIGARAENFVALHLYKFVNFNNDIGRGELGLYFLRDKEKREVDFLVVRNNEPWFIVEVKYSSKSGMSSNLHYYHNQIATKHAFQVVFDLPYVNKDCFEFTSPVIVPAATFLSQLV